MNASVMCFMAFFFSFHSCSGGLTMTFKSEQASRSDLQNVVTVKYERPANITCCPQWLPLSCRLELQHPLRGFNGCSPMQAPLEGDARAAFLWCSHSGGRACANLSRTSSWVSVGDPGGSGGDSFLYTSAALTSLRATFLLVIVCVTWFIAVEVL